MNLDAAISSKKAKLDNLQQQISQIQSDITNIDNRLNQLIAVKNELESRNATDSEQYKTIVTQINSLTQQKQDLQQQLQTLNQQYKTTQEEYQKLLRAKTLIESSNKKLEEIDSIKAPQYNPYPPGTDLYESYKTLLNQSVEYKKAQYKKQVIENTYKELNNLGPEVQPYISDTLFEYKIQNQVLDANINDLQQQIENETQRYSQAFNNTILSNPNIDQTTIENLQNLTPTPDNITISPELGNVTINSLDTNALNFKAPKLANIPSSTPTIQPPKISTQTKINPNISTPTINNLANPIANNTNSTLSSFAGNTGLQQIQDNAIENALSNTTASSVQNQSPLPPQSEIIYGLPESIELQVLGQEVPFSWQNNFVICEIFVGEMKYNASPNILNAWDFVDKTSEFLGVVNKILSYAGINPSKIGRPPLKFALQNFSANDTIVNEYGESTFQEVNNMLGAITRDFAYYSSGNWETFKQMLSQNLETILGPIGKASTTIGSALSKIISAIPIVGNLRQKFANTFVGNILSGKRVDVPKVWHNSTCSMAYSMKIRLSASVENEQEIIDMVLTPLTMLLVMSAPRADQTYMYRWPYVLNVNYKGLGYIPMGVVTELQIARPGDSQIYTHQGRFLNIDVTMNIQPLYNTMFTYTESGAPGGAKYMLTVNELIKKIAEGLKL